MRIAYFSKTNLPSAAANSLQSMQVCSALVELKHVVTFFVITEQDSNDNADMASVFKFYNIAGNFNIEQIKIPTTKESRFRYLWSVFVGFFLVARVLIRRDFDVVFGRDLVSCWVATLVGVKTIYESHAPVWFSLVERLIFKVFVRSKNFFRLVVISHALKNSYKNRYPDLQNKIFVAPDGAETVRGDGPKISVRERSSKLNVGYVGHLYEGKGIEVIEGIAGHMPEVAFHIIGGDTESIRYWTKRIKFDNVFFYGFVSRRNLPSYYESLDVCLLPNQARVFGSGSGIVRTPVNIGSFTSPLKLFEYMAYGKAIIASDLPVLREVLHESIALFVDPKDFDGWKEAIRSLASEARRETLGRAARQEFETKYTWTRRMERILDVH
jgi:glycosyltransferase involved in cell wall biosynthesis